MRDFKKAYSCPTPIRKDVNLTMNALESLLALISIQLKLHKDSLLRA